LSAKTIKHKTVKQAVKPVNVIDLDNAFHKYFWLIIPVLTIVYYISSRYSLGFYQDDEIAQFLNAVQFKENPFAILGNNPKPGWKIFLVIPAMFGYQPVLLFNSLISALTVYLTYRYIRMSGIKYAFAGAVLLAVQPLFFDLSFRSYSEIFTAFCLILFLILYHKKFYFLSGLLCGYIFTIRQEIAVFCIILGIIFIIRKKYLPFIAIGVFPVVYSLLGYLKTGDIFFVMTEMKSVASLVYNSQGVFHYFRVYIFIVGPVVLSLFLLGFFGFLNDTSKLKEYTKRYMMPYILFITIFGVQIWTMWNNGPNPGNWRYLLHISPLAVFFATVGLNNLGNQTFRKTYFILTGALFLFVIIFVSKGTDGFILLETSDYTKALTIAGLFALTMLIPFKSTLDYLNKLSVAVVLLAIVFIAIDFTPKKLSPENQTVKTVAEFINGKQGVNSDLYANHTVLFFFTEGYIKAPSHYKSLNAKSLETAPAGSLIVWENHYGYRPEWGSDVKLETIQNNRNFRLLNQFSSLDRRFAAYVFEKIN